MPAENYLDLEEKRQGKTARLLRVWYLLHNNPQGLKSRELASLTGVSTKAIQHYLKDLQSVIGVPIWQKGWRYGVNYTPGGPLPPVHLTLDEAMALYLSARLFRKYADEGDPQFSKTFAALGSVLPPPIARHVQEAANAMAERRQNIQFAETLSILTTSWANSQRVVIWYPHIAADGSLGVEERLFEPYFIEPSSLGHSCYVVGWDHHAEGIRTFKIERIRDVELTDQPYSIPEGWSAKEYLRDAWDIYPDGEVVEVRIRFSEKVASRVKEAAWHPSQKLVDAPDGTVVLSVRLAGTLEITPWILSWGDEIEVLAPPELRAQVAEIARRQATLYSAPQLGGSPQEA